MKDMGSIQWCIEHVRHQLWIHAEMILKRLECLDGVVLPLSGRP